MIPWKLDERCVLSLQKNTHTSDLYKLSGGSYIHLRVVFLISLCMSCSKLEYVAFNT